MRKVVKNKIKSRVRDTRTKEEKDWIKCIERAPKDLQDYIKDLHHELHLCYDYMEKKEEIALTRNEWNKRKGLHDKFFYLLNDRWLYKLGERIDKKCTSAKGTKQK